MKALNTVEQNEHITHTLVEGHYTRIEGSVAFVTGARSLKRLTALRKLAPTR